MTRDPETKASLLARLLAVLVLLALVTGLTACGGGGGGGDDGAALNQGQANSNWDTLVWDQDDWQ